MLLVDLIYDCRVGHVIDKNCGAGEEDWPLIFILFDFMLGSLIALLHRHFNNSWIYLRLCDSLTLAQVPIFDQSSTSLKMRPIDQIIIILIHLHFHLGQGVLRHEHALSDK